MAPRIARGIVVTVLAGMALISLIRVLMIPIGVLATVVSVSCLAALFGLQLLQRAWAGRPERLRNSCVALGVQAALIYLPLIAYQEAWVGLPGFFAGSILLVLRPRIAWAGFTAVIASITFAMSLFDAGLSYVAYTSVSALITGLIVYGLSRLEALVSELHGTQRALSDAAVIQERLRFARDLHDLLGYSLSAMTLKAELAQRLTLKQPSRAQHELAEILDTSRRALADIRSVTHGDQALCPDDELDSVRSVLAAAGVELRVRTDHGDLPVRPGTVVATVIREGVTNLLRHSRAEHCDISVLREAHRVTAEVVNDGVERSDDRDEPAPSGGLGNLADRAAALGGTLTADFLRGGCFRLAVVLPLRPAGAAEDPTQARDGPASSHVGGPAG